MSPIVFTIIIIIVVVIIIINVIILIDSVINSCQHQVIITISVMSSFWFSSKSNLFQDLKVSICWRRWNLSSRPFSSVRRDIDHHGVSQFFHQKASLFIKCHHFSLSVIILHNHQVSLELEVSFQRRWCIIDMSWTTYFDTKQLSNGQQTKIR